MRKALIAMSGGVDSSVAAYLTKKDGYDCIGAMMRLYDCTDFDCTKASTCADDVKDAEMAAKKLGIPFYVFDFKDDFKNQVINRFICAYESGNTPNPCIDCNKYMKFGRLLRSAEELGCEKIVTGHYARTEKKNGRILLKKALDETKDQSYVLYSLTQEQLSRVLFPLGSYRKTEIRKIAEGIGFSNAAKRESQDICFVPDGDYAAVIERYTGKVFPEGNFLDKDGNILGRHGGIIRYTVGQRKGLGISFGRPLYVCEKRVSDNAVVLGNNSDLFKNELIVPEFNWIEFENPGYPFKAYAKIRYNQPEQPAEVIPIEGGGVKIVFDAPQRAIAPGQSAVVYNGDSVVGGGVIK